MVRNTVNGRQTGRYIPQTVITDAACGKALVVVPYGEGRRFQTQLGNARRLMENNMRLIPDAAPPKVGGDTAALRDWTDVRGRTMKASLLGRAGLDVRLRKQDGTVVSVPMAQLSQADQQFVKLNAK